MYCPQCGTKNLNESIYCEKCGKRLKKSKISIFIIAIILLIILFAAIIFAYNISNQPSNPNQNSMNVNNSTLLIINSTNSSTPTNKTNLIDSGSTKGYDGLYYNSNYVSKWKTYSYGKDKVKISIKWDFKDVNEVLTQKITIEKLNNRDIRITVVPDIDGGSNYETYTSANGYKDALDYYWTSYKPMLYRKPEYRH